MSVRAFAGKVTAAELHRDREILACAEEARPRMIRPGLKVKIARRLDGNLTGLIATSEIHRTALRLAGLVRVASVLRPSVIALRLILTNALSDRKTTDRHALNRDGSLHG